jgi:hypothetical protein
MSTSALVYFTEQISAIRNAPAITCNSAEEARNGLAEVRLREQTLRTLKSDIKRYMQQIRQNYTTARSTVHGKWYDQHPSADKANQRQNLTHKEVQELAPYEQVARDVDALIQWLEHIKLDINYWITAHK